MKKYNDCERGDSMCGICSLSNYGRDCHNNKINKLKLLRTLQEMTQNNLATKSGINIRTIQKYESGQYNIENITLKNAKLLSNALECEIECLI